MTKGASAELALTRRQELVPHQVSGNAVDNVEAERYHKKIFQCGGKGARVSEDAMNAYGSMQDVDAQKKQCNK